MPDYLTKLNAEQYEAATSIDGMNFILAGAGSGKTTVLVSRVAYMINSGIPANEILLLTFTNKAANEMKERIVRSIGETANEVTACTFHSFCANFIRRNARLFGFKQDYTILDSPDTMDVMGISVQEFLNKAKKEGKDYNLKDFPKPVTIASVYENAVNNCVDVVDVIDAMKLNVYEEEIIEIINFFKQYKKDRDLMDYNDLLFFTEKILSENESLRAHMDAKYKYISCDEYQDTNTIQNNILNLMSKDFPNLTVVGDDNQSIYSFRSANIQNILQFDTVHPECKTIVLNQNYRSSQEILDTANAMMEYATEGKKKYLKGLYHGNKPKLIVKRDAYEEARYVFEKILEKKEEYDLCDMAVICRSASQSYILEQMLNSGGIPYDKYGGIKFLEQVIVKDILSFLRVSVNIQDEIALFRILQLYPGIGKTYAHRISELITSQNIDVAIEKYKKRNFAKFLIEFKDVVEKLQKMKLSEQLEYIIEDYYVRVKENSIEVSDITDDKKIVALAIVKESIENAKTLYKMAEKYRSTNRFLNDLVLDATVPDADDDKLVITTIHSAKGLEWDIVFVLDCIEGVTPICTEEHKQNAEELRCMYVAITRAKNELYLMVPEFYQMRMIEGKITHFLNKVDILNTVQRNVDNKRLMGLCETPSFRF